MHRISLPIVACLLAFSAGCVGSSCWAQPELTLSGHWIAGSVIAPDGKTPIRYALVQAHPIGHKGSSRSTRTDSEGTFMMGGVSAGKYRISLSTGSHSTPVAEKEVDLAQGPVSLRWQLPPIPTFAGQVLDAQGRRIRRSVLLTMKAKPGSRGGPRGVWTYLSGADGSYLLVGFSPGSMQICVIMSGQLRITVPVDEIEIEEGKSYQHDLTLPPALQAEGRVTDPKGDPVTSKTLPSRARFKLAGQLDWQWASGNVWTDEQGRFQLTELPAGTYQLWLYLSGQACGVGPELSLSEDVAVPRIDVALKLSAKITGTVLDHQGRAVAQASVQLDPSEEENPQLPRLYQRSNGKGRFTFADLPAGTYHIRSTARRKAEVLRSDPLKITVNWGDHLSGRTILMKKIR